MEDRDAEKGVPFDNSVPKSPSFSSSAPTRVPTDLASSKNEPHLAKDKQLRSSPSLWDGLSWRKRVQFKNAVHDDGAEVKGADDDFRRPKITPVHGGPLGYPLLARFLDSDDNYMTYRRFGNVQSRLLLEAQDDVRHLEQQLDILDRTETMTDPDALRRRSCGDAWSPKRKELLKSLKEAFNDYASLMASANTLTSLNKPTDAEYGSVENFINNEKPVVQREYSWIYHKEDLVTLRQGREHAWLDAQIERALKLCDCKLVQRIFCSQETAQKALNSPTNCEVYYTRSRVETCVNVIITLMILVLLIVPIWLLYHLTVIIPDSGAVPQHINAACIMGVLLVFTLLFSAGLSFFTRAKRHEVLAAAAGYCAVLVVFVGNVNGGRGVP